MMRNVGWTLGRWGMALTLLAGVGCGGENGNSSAPGDAGPGADGSPGHDGGTGEVDQRVVGPEGGTLSLWNGDVTLDVPPGAVAEPTTITAERFAPPSGLGLIEDAVYDFGPDGSAFSRPLTVSFRLEGVDIDALAPDLRIAKLVDGNLELQPTLPVAEGDARVRAQLDSFSVYGPVDKATGCGAFRPPRGLSAAVLPNRQGVRISWSGPGDVPLELQRAVVSAGDPCSCRSPRRRGCIEDDANPGQCILNGLQDPNPGNWEQFGSARLGDGYIDDPLATSLGVYTNRVRAGAGNCTSAWSSPVRAIVFAPRQRPAVPRNVVVQPLPCGGARLTWNAVPEANGYEIQRRRYGTTAPFQKIGSATGTELSFADTATELEPGAEYEYAVVATNAAGKSPASNVKRITNADSEFIISLSNRNVRVPPGGLRAIDLGVRRYGHESFDVELRFETLLPSAQDAASAGVTPTFVPRTVDLDRSTLQLDAHPDVNPGVIIEGQIVATTTVAGGTSCRTDPIRIEVGDPTCRVDMPDIALDPSGQTSVDVFLDRAGFAGGMNLSIENTDASLPLSELGVFPTFIPNPARTQSSIVFDIGSLPFPNYQGTIRVTAESTTEPGVSCETAAGFRIDGGSQNPTCDAPLTVDIQTSADYCETTFDFEGKTYDAWELDEESTEIYLYPETNRPIWKREWAPGLPDSDDLDWVESLQTGKEIDLHSGWSPMAYNLRVWDRDCDRSESASDYVILVPGDGKCD